MHKKCRTAYENCGSVKNSLLPNRYHHLMINHSELTLKLWVGVNANMEIMAEALSRKTSTLTAYKQWIYSLHLQTHLCSLTHLMKNSRQTRQKWEMSSKLEMKLKIFTNQNYFLIGSTHRVNILLEIFFFLSCNNQ